MKTSFKSGDKLLWIRSEEVLGEYTGEWMSANRIALMKKGEFRGVVNDFHLKMAPEILQELFEVIYIIRLW